jgi:hypothetical protein
MLKKIKQKEGNISNSKTYSTAFTASQKNQFVITKVKLLGKWKDG